MTTFGWRLAARPAHGLPLDWRAARVEKGRWVILGDMAKRERIRAVRRASSAWWKGLIDTFAEVADELAAIEDEIADAAFLGTAQDRLASAKEQCRYGARATTAVAERGRGQRRGRGGRVRRTPPTVRPQGARAVSPLVYAAEVRPMPVRPPTSGTASTSV